MGYKPNKAYDVYIVEMDKEVIAYCNSRDDSKRFIEYYKKNGSPSKNSVFEIKQQVVLIMN
jgi:hypothetical protein